MKDSDFFFSKDCPLKDLGGGTSRRVLAHNSQMLIAEVHFDKGSIGSVHTHEHTQCTYVNKGSFLFNIDGDEKVVKTGDSLVFASNVKHGCKCLEEGILIDVFTPCREDFLK